MKTNICNPVRGQGSHPGQPPAEHFLSGFLCSCILGRAALLGAGCSQIPRFQLSQIVFLSSALSFDLTKFPAFPKTCLGPAYMKMHVENQNERIILYILLTIILLFLCVVSWVKGFLALPGLVSCSVFVLCC